jgi:hypothetical protein
MNFILIDGEIYLATKFKCTRNIESTTSSASGSMGTYTTVKGETISGEMLLFHKNSLPDFQSKHVPRPLRIEFKRDGRLYLLEDTLFTSYKSMEHAYDCAAARIEYTADSIEITETQDISTHISNQ